MSVQQPPKGFSLQGYVRQKIKAEIKSGFNKPIGQTHVYGAKSLAAIQANRDLDSMFGDDGGEEE